MKSALKRRKRPLELPHLLAVPPLPRAEYLQERAFFRLVMDWPSRPGKIADRRAAQQRKAVGRGRWLGHGLVWK